MILLRLLLTAFIGLGAISPATATPPAGEGAVIRYLRGHERIRVLVVNAPAFGHQMTAVTWVQRLRELGFAGEIELVVENNVAPKLRELLPSLPWPADPLPETLLFEKERIRVITKSTLKSELQTGSAPQVRLAIVPAEDWYDGQAVIRTQAAGRPTPKADLGAQNILRMQPSRWRDGHRSMERFNGDAESLEDLFDLPLGLPAAPTPRSLNPADLQSWLAEILPSAPAAEGARIAAYLADDSFDQLPFYCAHSEQVVYLVRLGVAAARVGKAKPIRIWLSSRMTDFQWGNVRRSLERQGPVSIELVDLEHNLREHLGSDSMPAQVEIVRLNRVPPPLMRWLAQRATLPPAVTGKFSQNLMFQLGRPFLELKYFDEVQAALGLSGEVFEQAQTISRDMNFNVRTAEPADVAPALARFWAISSQPEAHRQYSKQKITNESQDLVYASLKRMAEFSICESSLIAPKSKPK